MVLRNGKEVDNKVSEKKHDKDERPETIESDFEIVKENDPSPSLAVSDHTVTYEPRVPYPQALDALFPSKKDKQRDCLLYTSPSPRDGLLSRMPSSA